MEHKRAKTSSEEEECTGPAYATPEPRSLPGRWSPKECITRMVAASMNDRLGSDSPARLIAGDKYLMLEICEMLSTCSSKVVAFGNKGSCTVVDPVTREIKTVKRPASASTISRSEDGTRRSVVVGNKVYGISFDDVVWTNEDVCWNLIYEEIPQLRISVQSNDRLVGSCGYIFQIRSDKYRRFSFECMQWSSPRLLPNTREDPIVVSANDLIYVFGGFGLAGGTRGVDVYSPMTDSWRSIRTDSLVSEREFNVGAVVGNVVFAFFFGRFSYCDMEEGVWRKMEIKMTDTPVYAFSVGYAIYIVCCDSIAVFDTRTMEIYPDCILHGSFVRSDCAASI